jgi:glucose-1-phosphate thymidylyltransferase
LTNRKGIILAGGSGTRLFPLTKAVSKHLLQLWDKPIIYYPLSVLMLTGIREIAIITTPQDQPQFQSLLGDGSTLGIRIEWIVQSSPDGLAQAYILAESFLDGQASAMILGDNVHYGHGLWDVLNTANNSTSGGTVFGYRVSDPKRFGIVTLDKNGKPLSVEEKPEQPKSNLALTGLYFFDARAPAWAKEITPSARGELEITALIEKYLDRNELTVELMGRGFTWLDTGTKDGLVEAGEFIRVIEKRQGLKIGCPEEVALRMGFIDTDQLLSIAEPISSTSYGEYLIELAAEHALS